ncbi:MAG: hypothetical protein HY697_03585 [Deltaproteobacteria bacterium]|nr:hypothetical protein [Deltaproteobacteria bacterium]
MESRLLQALERSDLPGASAEAGRIDATSAWDVHLSLFPFVQRVQNPPFINPHLPKMYRIIRELASCLQQDEIAALVRLEIIEYTRRPKLGQIPRPARWPSQVSFADVKSAILQQDIQGTAALLAAFAAREGGTELIRRMLLLGSGYIGQSLGHSISCSAFILLEMLERKDQDFWPAVAALADYFCKGRFGTTPELRQGQGAADARISGQLLRAASGQGIVNLHHMITLYAIEQVRDFFAIEEFNHLIESWITFLGDKQPETYEPKSSGLKISGYEQFYPIFSRLEEDAVVASALPMIVQDEERKRLGRYLVKGICDLYQGDYNPHYLTGLGSTLWALDKYRNRPEIGANVLRQFLIFYFESLKEKY